MYVMADERISVDRSKAIEAALLNIEKRFGKGSIMRLGERDVSDAPAISTTSLSLDVAIGIGGVPRGRIVEIYGPESSGKSTLAMHIVAQAQQAGGVAAYIDAEHAMDAQYAAKLGVNVDDMLISQPDSGEQALEIAEALVRSNGVDVIVVDSVAALVRRAELDGEMGDLLDLASNNRVIEKSGAWFSYKGERLGQGRENAKQTLKEHPELLRKIENDVKRALGMPVREEAAAEPAEQKKAAAAVAEKK